MESPEVNIPGCNALRCFLLLGTIRLSLPLQTCGLTLSSFATNCLKPTVHTESFILCSPFNDASICHESSFGGILNSCSVSKPLKPIVCIIISRSSLYRTKTLSFAQKTLFQDRKVFLGVHTSFFLRFLRSNN